MRFSMVRRQVEILRRLMVGSEGTLGFAAEAVYKTYHLPAKTTVAWLPFDTIDAAVQQIGTLVELGAQAVELMVASSLTAASGLMKGTPKYWRISIQQPLQSCVLIAQLLYLLCLADFHAAVPAPMSV